MEILTHLINYRFPQYARIFKYIYSFLHEKCYKNLGSTTSIQSIYQLHPPIIYDRHHPIWEENIYYSPYMLQTLQNSLIILSFRHCNCLHEQSNITINESEFFYQLHPPVINYRQQPYNGRPKTFHDPKTLQLDPLYWIRSIIVRFQA